VLALIIALRQCTTLGSWLLAPYLAWVSFAAVLNYDVVKLNAPFTGSF
jgi:tryptophan-rich sensory protein